jgi:hypothetical protein
MANGRFSRVSRKSVKNTAGSDSQSLVRPEDAMGSPKLPRYTLRNRLRGQ